MQSISNEERRARLATRHLLLPGQRTDNIESICDSVVALHSSDPVSVYLSAGARMSNPSIQAIDEALYDSKLLSRHHAMRRTLWVTSQTVTPLAHASSSRAIAARERTRTLQLLEDSDVEDPQAWLEAALSDVLRLVSNNGPIGTRAVGSALPDLAIPLTLAPGKPYEATINAHGRVLLLAAFEGLIVRTRPSGTWISSEYAWSSAEMVSVDEESASAALVDLWLQRFGPGSDQDLRWWTGWTGKQVSQALEKARAVRVELEDDVVGWVSVHDLPSPPIQPWVSLLPALDPTTMGWKNRDWYLSKRVADRVFDRNGNGGPTVWIDGEIVGGWAQRPDGAIVTDIPEDVTSARREEISEACERVTALVADTRYRVRFPPPNQGDLFSAEHGGHTPVD